jgi:hypothetical protein
MTALHVRLLKKLEAGGMTLDKCNVSRHNVGMKWQDNATKDERAELAARGKRKVHYKRLAAQEQVHIMRIYERVKKRMQRERSKL